MMPGVMLVHRAGDCLSLTSLSARWSSTKLHGVRVLARISRSTVHRAMGWVRADR